MESGLLNVYHDDEHFENLSGGHFNTYGGLWGGDADTIGVALTESLDGILPSSPEHIASYYAPGIKNGGFLRARMCFRNEDLPIPNGLPHDIFNSSGSSDSFDTDVCQSPPPLMFNFNSEHISEIKEVGRECITPSVEIIRVDPDVDYNSPMKNESVSSSSDDDYDNDFDIPFDLQDPSTLNMNKNQILINDSYDEKITQNNGSCDTFTNNEYRRKSKRTYNKSISLPQSPHAVESVLGPASLSFEDLAGFGDLGSLDLSPQKCLDLIKGFSTNPGTQISINAENAQEHINNNLSTQPSDLTRLANSTFLSPIKPHRDIITPNDCNKNDLDIEDFDLTTYIMEDDCKLPLSAYSTPLRTCVKTAISHSPNNKNVVKSTLNGIKNGSYLPNYAGKNNRSSRHTGKKINFDQFSMHIQSPEHNEVNLKASRISSELNRSKSDSENDCVDVETVTESPQKRFQALYQQFDDKKRKANLSESKARSATRRIMASLPVTRNVNRTRMQDAGMQLSRNKLLSLVSQGGGAVKLDHDYCSPTKRKIENATHVTPIKEDLLSSVPPFYFMHGRDKSLKMGLGKGKSIKMCKQSPCESGADFSCEDTDGCKTYEDDNCDNTIKSDNDTPKPVFETETPDKIPIKKEVETLNDTFNEFVVADTRHNRPISSTTKLGTFNSNMIDSVMKGSPGKVVPKVETLEHSYSKKKSDPSIFRRKEHGNLKHRPLPNIEKGRNSSVVKQGPINRTVDNNTQINDHLLKAKHESMLNNKVNNIISSINAVQAKRTTGKMVSVLKPKRSNDETNPTKQNCDKPKISGKSSSVQNHIEIPCIELEENKLPELVAMKKRKLNLQEYKKRREEKANEANTCSSVASMNASLKKDFNEAAPGIKLHIHEEVNDKVCILESVANNAKDKIKNAVNMTPKIFDPIGDASRKATLRLQKARRPFLDPQVVPITPSSALLPVVVLEQQKQILDEPLVEESSTDVPRRFNTNYEEIIMVSIGINTDENNDMVDINNVTHAPTVNDKVSFKISKKNDVLVEKNKAFDCRTSESEDHHSPVKKPTNNHRGSNSQLGCKKLKIFPELLVNITDTIQKVASNRDVKISSNSLLSSIQDVVLKKTSPQHSGNCSPSSHIASSKVAKITPLYIKNNVTGSMSVQTPTGIVAEHGEDKVIMHLRKDRIKPDIATSGVQTDFDPQYSPLKIVPKVKIVKPDIQVRTKSESIKNIDKSNHNKTRSYRQYRYSSESSESERGTTRNRRGYSNRDSVSPVRKARDRDYTPYVNSNSSFVRHNRHTSRRSISPIRQHSTRPSSGSHRSRQSSRSSRRYRRSRSNNKTRRDSNRSQNTSSYRYKKQSKSPSPRTNKRHRTITTSSSNTTERRNPHREASLSPNNKKRPRRNSSSSTTAHSRQYRSSSSHSSSQSPEYNRNRTSHYRSTSNSSRSSSRSQSRSRNTRKNSGTRRPTSPEERRIVFVGRIEAETTKADLKRKFQLFGSIKQVTIHYKENGVKYGFVTFDRPGDAYAAIEKAPRDPQLNIYDISFGGRRQFCRASYADLDGGGACSQSRNSGVQLQTVSSAGSGQCDFDALLKQVKEKLRDKKAAAI